MVKKQIFVFKYDIPEREIIINIQAPSKTGAWNVLKMIAHTPANFVLIEIQEIRDCYLLYEDVKGQSPNHSTPEGDK